MDKLFYNSISNLFDNSIDRLNKNTRTKILNERDTKEEENMFWKESIENAKKVENIESRLSETENIIVPSKMDLYEDLDITEKDGLVVSFKSGTDFGQVYRDVLLFNGEGNMVGIFTLNRYRIDGETQCILTADSRDLKFGNHKSTKYYFVFCDKSMCMYKVPIEVTYHKTEVATTHLCIDFGTSNTTAGCYLDEHYVENISNIAMINKNVILDAENVVAFINKDIDRQNLIQTLSYKNIVPTIVYVDDCSDAENIKYSFGYEASQKIKKDKYCPKGSCFMEIKRWTSNINIKESIQDTNGNKASVSRKEILSEYLMFIIRNAENQFKCHFKNVHITVPVKLKDKVLDLYADILKEKGYVLEQEHAIDEGVAVLYSIINNQIKDKNYINGEESKALIIDCGGGTSDLASCTYKIDKDEDGIINLDITTEYMNGDVNFGGNNLTYRIMQYMKIVYAENIKSKGKSRINIDELITQDVNALFSYIEGELENDDDSKVKERYDDVYKNIESKYKEVEDIIPTQYAEYENQPTEKYDKVKNNFYFLWKLADEMKKEFYRSTSISRYTIEDVENQYKDIDLHVDRVEEWRLSTKEKDELKNQSCPEVTFTAKEIDKLLRADIYYLVRKFLNGLYMDNSLTTYSQIKLSGQSSKINIFMDSLKEFLPGKKIKSGRIKSKGNDAEELKLLCLKGAIMYLHALEKSNIEVSLKNETKNIPLTVYIKSENDEDKIMFEQGSDWEQKANSRRITNAGKEIFLNMRNADKEIGEPYKYTYEKIKYNATDLAELKKISNGKITQDETESLKNEKKYIYVYLNKEKWGFEILPLYKDGKEKLFCGPVEFVPFETEILQETFFDGRK